MDKITNPAQVADSSLEKMQKTLQTYHYVASTLEFFRVRWERDRKTGYSSSRREKLVVADFQVLGELGATGLADHVRVPNGKYIFRLHLLYHKLSEYFETQLLEDILVALLADKEDPKVYEEAYNGARKRYPHNHVEHLLKKLTRLR